MLILLKRLHQSEINFYLKKICKHSKYFKDINIG